MLGSKRFLKLLQEFGAPEHCFNGFEPRTEFLRWCNKHQIALQNWDWKGAEADVVWSETANHHIINFHSQSYPEALKRIASPPPLLFIIGNPKCLSKAQLGMVGSRNPTPTGKENAYSFAAEISKQGLIVTSGLAMGIDAQAHEGALTTQQPTIAVLGHGLDTIYPACNKKLFAKIAKQGALVSEFPIGVPPKRDHFPRRNRIISGLSLGVLVVEATKKSGSLITAYYALEQGREVFALPGSITNPLAKGCNQLLREGASMVETVDDIFQQLQFGRLDYEKCEQDPICDNNRYSLIPDEPLNIDHQQVYESLEESSTPIDLVVTRTGLTAIQVSSILLELELKGEVQAVPGGYVRN